MGSFIIIMINVCAPKGVKTMCDWNANRKQCVGCNYDVKTVGLLEAENDINIDLQI